MVEEEQGENGARDETERLGEGKRRSGEGVQTDTEKEDSCGLMVAGEGL